MHLGLQVIYIHFTECINVLKNNRKVKLFSDNKDLLTLVNIELNKNYIPMSITPMNWQILYF